MDTLGAGGDTELAAMQSVLGALEPLDPQSRQRVFEYIAARLGIPSVRGARSGLPVAEENQRQSVPDEDSVSEAEFGTLAELHDAANPRSDKDRVLVTAYWLQTCEGAESFVSYSVNKALKDLGHGVSNVTGAFEALKRSKPALVLQLKKAGKSRQARKTYKITKAGVAAVKAMVDA